jgi:hypothetical protein
MIGRYPFNTAYGFRAKLAQATYREPDSIYDLGSGTMWSDWFFGIDGIGFGIIKRWTGLIWEVAQNIRVHAF